MQRLYFLVPDINTTVDIAQELAALKLTRDEVHILGRDTRQLSRHGLNEATLKHTSDVANAALRGLKYGIPLGALLGVVVYFFLSDAYAGLSIWGAIIGMAIFGGLFGVWSSTMIGVSVYDTKVAKYKKRINHGDYLMMVDVSDEGEREVVTAIHRHHPEVTIDKVTTEERQHEGVGN